MQENYNTPDSFKIGDEFEKFVENNIFTKDKYALIHRTGSKKDNEERYPESASGPDFKFRCLETGVEFYVEAKYRSSAIENRVKGLKKNQEIRFKKINKVTPVFVIFGYWGKPSNPSKLSLLRLEDCKYSSLFTYYLANFEIIKKTYPNELLKIESNNSNKTESTKTENTEKKYLNHNIKKESVFFKNKKIITALAAIGIIALFVSIYSFAFSTKETDSTPKKELKLIVDNYYQAMNSNQVEKLPDFLSSKIISWYGAKNPTQEEILRNAKAHRGKYPFSTSDIDWNSFTVIQEDNGDYHVSYEMIYKSKEEITDDYKVYDLKLLTKWDEDFKLKSITEVRL